MDAVGSVVWSAEVGDVTRDVCLHNDVLATAHPREIRLWKMSEGRQFSRIPTESRVNRVCFSPSGVYLAAIVHHLQVAIWDMSNTSEAKLVIKPIEGAAIAWSPSGDSFAIGTADGEVKLWSLEAELKTISTYDGRIGDISWSSPCTFHTLASCGTVRTFNIDDEWVLDESRKRDESYRRKFVPGDPKAHEIGIVDEALIRRSARGKKQLACTVGRPHIFKDLSKAYVVTESKNRFYFWPHQETPPLSALSFEIQDAPDNPMGICVGICRLLDDHRFAYCTIDHIFICSIPRRSGEPTAAGASCLRVEDAKVEKGSSEETKRGWQ